MSSTTTWRPRARTPGGSGLATLVFLLPMLLVFGLFSWWPIVRSFVMSVQHTNLVTAPEFVGLDNFRAVLADPLLGTAVQNTLWFALLALVLGYPVPLVAAVLMSDVRRARGLYALLAYLPVVIPPAVAVLLWKVFYDAEDDRRLQHHPRLGRPGPGAVAGDGRHGHAVARPRGDLGGGRRHRHHLPGRARLGARPSSTTRPRSTAPASGARSGTSPCRTCAASW